MENAIIAFLSAGAAMLRASVKNPKSKEKLASIGFLVYSTVLSIWPEFALQTPMKGAALTRALRTGK